MRVGINLLYLLPGVVGGTETYAAGLLHGLAHAGGLHEYVVFVNEESARWPLPPAPNITRVICPVRAASRSRRYLFEQVRLPGLLKQHGVDVVHSLGYVGPLWTPCPALVTVPDLNYIALGKTLPPIRRLVLGLFSRAAARRARGVITISQFSKRAICRALKIAPGRVTVTPLGPPHGAASVSAAEVEAVKQRYGIARPYLVAIGGGAVHKNIPRLLAAFVIMKHVGPDLLVLVGHLQPDVNLTVAARQDVVSTGYVPAEHLLALLSGAVAFVLPSWYEGFGLPVLEAQRVGVPVVCSTAGSLPEVAGDAAVYFDPYSIADMAAQMALVAQSTALRAELRRKGLVNVQRFSWEQTARETLGVYARAYETSQQP